MNKLLNRVKTPGPWPNPSAGFNATFVAALSGAVIWGLNQYVFTNTTPSVLEVQVSVIVPAIVGWLIARLTRRYTQKAAQQPPVWPTGGKS